MEFMQISAARNNSIPSKLSLVIAIIILSGEK